MQIRMYYHPQVEMFVSVYANVHYHRYLGPKVAGCTILASSAAVLLLAATITPRLPHNNLGCELGGQFCTYFHQDKFYLRTDHTPTQQTCKRPSDRVFSMSRLLCTLYNTKILRTVAGEVL